MPEMINRPPIPQGNIRDQITQIYDYLCQMTDSINRNMASIGGNELTAEEMKVMQKILKTNENGAAEYATMKTMIIRTAEKIMDMEG